MTIEQAQEQILTLNEQLKERDDTIKGFNEKEQKYQGEISDLKTLNQKLFLRTSQPQDNPPQTEEKDLMSELLKEFKK